MTQDAFMQGLGVASQVAIFCVAGSGAIATIAHMLVTRSPRIIAALRGQTGLPLAPPQPFRPRTRQVTVAVPESTKMRDAA